MVKADTREDREKMETQSRGNWSWFFWAIMVVHCVAILIFTRGFLLTRTELPYYSNCSDIRSSPCLFDSDTDLNNTNNNNNKNNQSRNNQLCWTKPAVNRLVIIVLDALRFDFVAPSTFFEEPKPWMDKLLVLQKLASERNSSARIFKAIADPPTTSLQRLKGLATGGLPTFIDVGNSFGAPAILEDNLIHQLVLNGKKVVMMGDDTWIQLFPHHFAKSYPFPSFNVKDLHTVDNGCIDHLLPSLYEEDWDVLIAHFLGVDHAGHIFGVDSIPMIEKLEQYNTILERVIGVLESQSGPGGLHENTFLLVMGDHGQTLNGDHGGGGAEEVETSIFAMSFRKPPAPTPSEFGSSFCQLDLDQKNMCISSVQQLDFAVTVSALLGVSFPFGSIGFVNPELYALAGGTWELKGPARNCQKQSKLGEWMRNYVNVLCINSWQVKRYIDIYSASSVIGFSSEDLLQVSNLYAQAEEDWSSTKRLLLEHESCNASTSTLKRQIDAYFSFLSSVAELARSKWTEFNLGMMAVGFGIMLISLFMHFFAIKMVSKSSGIYLPSSVDSGFPTLFVVTLFIVMIRALSFLSNSYILEEGKVANFLLATIGVFRLRYSIRENKRLIEAVAFLLLISILRFAIEVGLSKQAATSAFMNANPSWAIGFFISHHVSTCIAEIVPILALIVLACMQYKTVADSVCCGVYKYVIVGTILSYMLIAVHWALESNLVDFVLLLRGIRRNFIPRIIYAIGFGQLLLLALSQLLEKEKALNCARSLFIKTVALLSACSSTVIILSGTQGPLIALACIIGGHCIARLQSVERNMKDETPGISTYDPLSVTQWSLLAVCLFFSSGHWCAFDGLRYGAAFIGFDEFVLTRQAILLTIDTFGFSHILPVFGLPYLVSCQELPGRQSDQGKFLIFMKLTQMYMIYGLITATALTATVLCVILQRRHLMVWGLFAPKFVFDVVGLILTDILICLASTYYFSQVKIHDAPQDQITEK